MPPQRLKLAHTLENKIKWVEDFINADPPINRVQFCDGRTFSRQAHQLWEKQLDCMKKAVAENNRGRCLTMGGSGRISPSEPVEDAICLWIKDERREERPVSMDSIICHCLLLLPGFIESKTHDARRSWCTKFMKRNALTIRKISHSGRKKHPQLEALKETFASQVATILISDFIDAATATPPPFVVFNMDQTAVYCDLGAKTTVDFVGVSRVPAHGGGKGSYRCTAALLVCADGRMLPPHFVFKGEHGKEVYDEVHTFCDPETATFSVQSKAWFCERVMHEWIEQVWQHVVTGPSVLILDCLKVHQCDSVRRRLAEMGTYTVYVPGGCTSVSQPLDVGVMAPFKRSLRARYTDLYSRCAPPDSASERRYDMFLRSMYALGTITPETIQNAFRKAGPFFPCGPIRATATTIISETGPVV